MSDQITQIPPYPIASLQLEFKESVGGESIKEVMHTIAPVEQRLKAIKSDLITVRTAEELRRPPGTVARQAMLELNDHFTRHPRAAILLGASYNELLMSIVDTLGPTDYEEAEALAFGAANNLVHTLGIVAATAARMPEWLRVEPEKPDEYDNAPVVALMDKFAQDPFVDDVAYAMQGKITEEDIVNLLATPQAMHKFPEIILDHKRAAGILALSSSLVFTTVRTVELVEILQVNRNKAAIINTTTNARVIEEVAKQENRAQQDIVVDDSPVDELMNVLGFNPVSNKELKKHELKKVLTVGEDVTLGQKYSFTGFGDNASIALGFIERINSVGATSIEEFAKVLDAWMSEAVAVSKSRHISNGARKLLEQYVSAVQGCLSLEFCQVASNFAKTEPTKKAINLLKQVRSHLGIA